MLKLRQLPFTVPDYAGHPRGGLSNHPRGNGAGDGRRLLGEIVLEPDRDPRFSALEHMAQNPSPMTTLMVRSLLDHIADENEDAFQEATTIMNEEEERMKVVFICGPFRSTSAWGVEQNVRRAEQLALKVAECGAMPLCPHTNTRFFDGLLTDEFWLHGTSELLARCDGIAFVDGWEASEGSRAEQRLAEKTGIRQFDSGLIGMPEWAS